MACFPSVIEPLELVNRLRESIHAASLDGARPLSVWLFCLSGPVDSSFRALSGRGYLPDTGSTMQGSGTILVPPPGVPEPCIVAPLSSRCVRYDDPETTR